MAACVRFARHASTHTHSHAHTHTVTHSHTHRNTQDEESLKSYVRAAELGHAQAAYLAGVCYEQGLKARVGI